MSSRKKNSSESSWPTVCVTSSHVTPRISSSRLACIFPSAAKPQPKSFSKKQEVDREWYTWTEPLINTVALARWKDALSTGKLFQPQKCVNRPGFHLKNI